METENNEHDWQLRTHNQNEFICAQHNDHLDLNESQVKQNAKVSASPERG